MASSDKKKYPAAQLHGELTQISDDVYVVSGSFKMGPGIRISNNMIVVKRGEELTVVNSVCVSEKVEEEIKKLGKVTNVVRLCSNHGASDEYYVDTYEAAYWDLPEAATTEGTTKVPATTNLLEDGKEFAGISGSKVVLVENLKFPDAVLFLPDGGGTLLTGDFVQNGCPTAEESFLAKNVVKRLMKFNTGCLCPPPMYFKFYGDGKDMAVNMPKLMELEFDTVISSHGPVVKGGAKKALEEGFAQVKKGDLWKA